MNQNPYQAPAESTVPSTWEQPKDPPFSIIRSFLMWSVICSVSAIPSLLLGFGVVETPNGLAAMATGIFIFAVAYTLIDCLYLRRWVRSNPALRRTLWIGYIGRMCLSAIVPAGVALDMFPGMMSLGLVQWLYGNTGQVESFSQILLTTLVQGVIMNIILLGLMLPIYGICRFAGMPNRYGDPISKTETDPPLSVDADSESDNPFAIIKNNPLSD